LSNEEHIKKAWDNASKAWVDFVRTGKDYTRDGLNNPATFDLIGNVEGLDVLDLACGEGYNTRILARRGARVTGVDISERLIEYARVEEENEKLSIQYYVLDAAHLKGLADNSFDLVTCFMSLQDIENYRKAVSEISRVLKLSGRFVFSIPHPCFEKIILNGKKIDAARRYFQKAKYAIQWNMERLSTPFSTFSFHRTLTGYFVALSENGLYVSKLVEPRLTHETYRKYPYLQDALARPQSVIIACAKGIP